jgi:iron complex transport system substrate-binding protein
MDYDKVVQIGQGKSVNLETIKTLGENIVAILPERSLDQIVLYESIGVPAVVALPNTESFETVKNSLLLVGKILGEEARAEKINAFIDRQILRAKEVSTHEPKKPSVLFLGGSSFLSVAPAAMIQSQLIEIAGGINAAQELDHKGGFANGKIKLFN